MNDIVRHASSVQKKVDRAREASRSRSQHGTCRQHTFRRGSVLGTSPTDSGRPMALETEGVEMTLGLAVVAANRALDETNWLVDMKVTNAAGGLLIP